MSASPIASASGAPAVPGAPGVSTGLDRAATAQNLSAAGQQFEAVFTGMMLKSMRQARLAETLFESKGLDTFRDMQDQKVVAEMAVSTPIGIGKAMTEFLARAQPGLNKD